MTSSIFKDQTPITSKEQLIQSFEKNGKSAKKIGFEDEKFIYTDIPFQRLPYTPAKPGEVSIPLLLEALLQNPAWQPVEEKGQKIGLSGEARGIGNISLEPGGQFEFSSHPCDTLHDLWETYQAYLRQVQKLAEQYQLVFLNSGVDPLTPLSQVPWVPKQRYDLMRAYMPQKGSLGLWMMAQTCTTQISLDFSDEQDMVRKFRLGLLLQPLVTAIFANSPFCEGSLNGYESYRAYIWTQTDPDRCGFLPFVFEAGMGFERYVDYALDVPMYFLYRGETYHAANGKTFRTFMTNPKGVHPDFEPTMADWQLHLTTLFPDVRLKNVLEMRGADSCSPENGMALAAFWVGLFYDASVLKTLEKHLKGWTPVALMQLYQDVPLQGLHAMIGGKTLYSWAEEILPLVYQGLVERGFGEEVFFDPLAHILETKRSPSDIQKLLFKETQSLDAVLAYGSL